MEENPDYKELAANIRKIDMNIHTLEELRVKIGETIDQYL
jgi:hypothetical protein